LSRSGRMISKIPAVLPLGFRHAESGGKDARRSRYHSVMKDRY